MSTKPQRYAPSKSDAAVRAKTGRDWAAWFGALDKAGAVKLKHKDIAQILSKKFGVPGWWSQCITVEYELARGLREKHQAADGFSVSVTKTVAASLSDLYEASVDASQRRKWFPKGVFKASSQTKDKYLNGAWSDAARLNIGFYAKGANKSQIAVQVAKLRKADVEAERAAWKAALAKLQRVLEG